MWMMGYNDGGESISGRKLRTLIPRPAPAAINHPPCLGRIHSTDLLSFNHHLATVTEQSKRDFNAQQVVVSSRWNPTPEQLQTLEELYRRGTRTPSAEQIQHITAQLRRYGKIEGKNVFYWFQNHKARERQKRRRQLESSSDEPPHNAEIPERKESGKLTADLLVEEMEKTHFQLGANGTGLEVERTKNRASPTNCSTLAEKTVSKQRAAKAAIPECRADGWVQFDEAELQQGQRPEERNATWHMMQFFGSSSPSTSQLINSTAATTMDPKHIKAHNYLDIFRSPHTDDLDHHLINVAGAETANEASCESQTLQLFPLGSSDGNHKVAEKDIEVSTAAMSTTIITPHKFFEFLPLKN